MLDLRAEIEQLLPELLAAIDRVVRSGRFILGPEVEAFEREICRYLGIGYAVALHSGTDALGIGLRTLDIRPGDEVITTSFSFFATAEAISHVGATPVFADIDPKTFNLDPASVEARLSSRTRAILPVHLFGHPANMTELARLAEHHDLPVLEDAAQAIGAEYADAKVGTLGTAAAFSFYPSKNLGAFGDAGLLATRSADLANVARSLRESAAGVGPFVHQGTSGAYVHDRLGYNSRLDELQAAILRVKLSHLDTWNIARRHVADTYRKHLASADVATPAELPPAHHVYHQYTLRISSNRRNAVREKLAAEGISSVVYYPVPLHRMAVYETSDVSLPESERAATEVLSLPIWPSLDSPSIERIAHTIKKALSSARSSS